ncbi:MAG: polya polymerase [Lachnospiraceae bacterium]|nr:polya polymerase [Lachnospiraceae bacterium]
MKFFNITDIDGFFEAIDQCKGKVELVSNDGDRLNLKSKLTKVIAYADVFSGGKIDELEILTSDPEDMRKLMNYVVTGEEPNEQ